MTTGTPSAFRRAQRRLRNYRSPPSTTGAPAVPTTEPLLSDQVRNSILYQRYLTLDFGVGDPGDLSRMVSIITNQFVIERSVEQALLQDGWSAGSILAQYTSIRGVVHTPQGRLLSPRTYESYVSQINEQGTRQSVPYRRITRALNNFDLVLERAGGINELIRKSRELNQPASLLPAKVQEQLRPNKKLERV